jgi:hypothetical protein
MSKGERRPLERVISESVDCFPLRNSIHLFTFFIYLSLFPSPSPFVFYGFGFGLDRNTPNGQMKMWRF